MKYFRRTKTALIAHSTLHLMLIVLCQAVSILALAVIGKYIYQNFHDIPFPIPLAYWCLIGQQTSAFLDDLVTFIKTIKEFGK